ncbi:hypothetical protein [Sodalis sp.]|uniref:hypothetical protein n=1 Tax=Sodalis sp. (in: enterobacteria) TaxID=1898979 RepID=UPI00387322FE
MLTIPFLHDVACQRKSFSFYCCWYYWVQPDIDFYLPVIPLIAHGLQTDESLIQSKIPLFIGI